MFYGGGGGGQDVWCVLLQCRRGSPHKLDGEMAESSGWTRGVNSTVGAFTWAAEAEFDTTGKVLEVDAASVQVEVLL